MNTNTLVKKIGQELARIRKQGNGVLTAESVVAFAKNADTALHQKFEWNDKIAGHKYRLEQAARIIQAHVVIDKTTHEAVRVYASSPQKQGEYRLATEAEQKAPPEDVRLQNAIRELRGIRMRYNDLKELKPVMDAIAQVQSMLSDDETKAA